MKTIRSIAGQFKPIHEGRWKIVRSFLAAFLGIAGAVSPAGSASPTIATEEILSRMEQRYEQQLEAIDSYQDRRRYSVAHALLGKSTYLLVEERYRAPEEKQFQVIEQHGPAAVQKSLFSRLLEIERELARESVRPDVDLCRRNYSFHFREYDPKTEAYIFDVSPIGSNPYLWRGTIWVNDQDFAVSRIEGEPIKRHSMFVLRTHFVHEFAKFGDFWFPVRHQSDADLFLFGHATLEISYSNYQWQTH